MISPRAFRRSAPLLASVAAAMALAAGGATASAATGSGANFAPDVLPSQLHVSIVSGVPGDDVMTTNLHWRSPDRYRMVVTTAGEFPYQTTVDWNAGTVIWGDGVPRRMVAPSRTNQALTIEPDAYDPLATDLLGWGAPLLARVRDREAPLTIARRTGKRVLRGRIRISSNECAGLRSGIRTVDFDPHTLMPVHVEEVRHRQLATRVSINLHASARHAFAGLRVRGRGDTTNQGFVRSTPAQAAASVAFPVSMPAVVPDGFTLDFAGHAPMGQTIGPEASFPKSNGVFAARYSRGVESLELTIRGATGTLAKDWDDSDPAAGECGNEHIEQSMVGAVKATYAIPEFGLAHLWWRNGATLYTLAAPLGRAQLESVASSLTVVPKG